MKIRRLTIKNFRGISSGEVLFPGHTTLIGSNSVGKSTICEALDLCIGPDRLSRSNPINEHDFYQRTYLGGEDAPRLIEIEVVLTDLQSELETKLRIHREYWDSETATVLDETANPEDTDQEHVSPALRIRLEGRYDPQEDEFFAESYFASPPPENAENRVRVSRAVKRELGFLYLRALRTGSRALSLERGSLLDVILRLKDDDKSKMWEQTLRSLEDLSPPIDHIPQIHEVLKDVDRRARQFVNLSEDDPSFRLYASELTRDNLRQSVTLFGASSRSKMPVPYWRLGSGIVNTLVFALLTFIADLKPNVVFAMEEPEIAIPPHTQRRIVRFITENMDQSIVTTHSPFVLEQYSPENVVVLERGNENVLNAKQVDLREIKAKTYRGHLRRVFAEGMLGDGVVCVEGISDAEVLRSASEVIERSHENCNQYTPLDLSGVTVVSCEGDGGILRYGEFFADLGLKTFAFFDKQKNANVADNIKQTFDRSWEIEQSGIEHLLVEELPIIAIRRFLSEASKNEDYPTDTMDVKRFEYSDCLSEPQTRDVAKKVLKQRKGSGYAQKLVEMCSIDELPSLIKSSLYTISDELPNKLRAVHDEKELRSEGTQEPLQYPEDDL